jgi:hypothetical protein
LLLGGASKIIARRFKLILDQFIQVSGGLINHNKSQIYAWNIKSQVIQGIAQILQFPISVEWKTFKYLGMPICLKALPGDTWKIFYKK